jgi:bifunctional enzyme CysN/CysC
MLDVPLRLNNSGTLSVYGPPGSGKETLAASLSAASRLIGDKPADPGTGDVALVVVDIREGLTPEARRQIAIACTTGASRVVLAINKVDLVNFDRALYESVAAAFKEFAAQFTGVALTTLPVAATTGDNVFAASERMGWYTGRPLAPCLEALISDQRRIALPLRLPIGSVSRPDPDLRLYAGIIASGTLRRGDTVQVAVSGVTSSVARIHVDGEEREQASAGESVAVALTGEIDLASGDILVHPSHRPEIAEQFAGHLVWFSDDEPLLPGRDYTLQMGTRSLAASVTSIKFRIDLETERHEAARTLKRGDVATCTIATSAPVAIDHFETFTPTGRFLLRDRHTDAIFAAGVVDFALRRGVNVHAQALSVSKNIRAALKAQRPCILWFTGLSGAGKSTLANHVEAKLATAGYHTYLLDGDNVRHGLTKDLGFTQADRVENIRRVGEVAKLFVDAGLIVLCSFISPFRAERSAVRELVGDGEFIEVFVNAPLDVCERRDPKGLYAKSRAGSLPNFTGVDSPYEPPENPDIVLDTTAASATELADRVIVLLSTRGIVTASAPNKR